MKKRSIHQPLHHYAWGQGCDGWTLVDQESLSVKQERMPPGTKEEWHLHLRAQQFFFILEGTATFEVEGAVLQLSSGEGVLMEAGKAHRIANDGQQDLCFLLCSQPSTRNDRQTVPLINTNKNDQEN